MSEPAPFFRRFLSPALTQALAELSQSPGWWRDVLLHRDLVLAIRTDALKAYHQGASVFEITMHEGRPVPKTHLKYLMRQKQMYVPLGSDGCFLFEPKEALWTHYNSPSTLGEMISMAARLAGPEKAGLHRLIKASPRVIDTEINIRSERDVDDDAPPSDGFLDDVQTEASSSKDASFDRLDAATLEGRGDQIWVVFHEAKHFANVELRAGPRRAPKVSEQIKRYRRSIAARSDQIKASYREVCSALLKLHDMRHRLVRSGHSEPTPCDLLIERVANGVPLHVDPEPRLIVFGFDKDQREGPIWQRHRERLSGEFGLTVYAIGNPTSDSAGAFARRP